MENLVNQREPRFNFSIEVDSEFMSLYGEAKAATGPVPARDVIKQVLKSFVERKTTTIKENTHPKKLSRVEKERMEFIEMSSRLVPKIIRHQTKNRIEA